VRCHASQPQILRLPSGRFVSHEQEVQWEADVEGICIVDLLDIFAGQLE
jgi:hypothetical protein